MGCCMKIALLVGALSAVGIGYLIHYLDQYPEIPETPDEFWGAGPKVADDVSIKPFQIEFTEQDVADLKRRLRDARLPPPPLEGVAFQYGMNSNYLAKLREHWLNSYDFKAREKLINTYPQFKTQVAGLDIHFIHIKQNPKKLPKGVEVVPLMLLHGWPGSVREFFKLIPMLTTPRDGESFAFDLIIPSLPGYGFSQRAAKVGMNPNHMAVIMKKLMDRLGYKKFYVHGGDWGSFVGASMAIYYPENVLGYHSNLCTRGSTLNKIKLIMSFILPSIFGGDENKDRLSMQLPNMLEETGYFHIQASKPDTVGVGLNDSPLGLAAYIIEKFSTWTNQAWKTKSDGGLSYYAMDDLLDNVMMYWISGSITSSMRLYSESMNSNYLKDPMTKLPVMVPSGCARFPNEILLIPRHLIEEAYPKLVRFSDMPKGGHFPAFEVPDLLAEDLWQFVNTVRTIETEKKGNKQKA